MSALQDAGGPALDLQEGISTPGTPGGGEACARWPDHLRLRSSAGDLIAGRCKATNLCPPCARIGAVENSELLQLDALEGVAPSIWAVLTTRTATDEPKPFYRAREKVLRALKHRWPAVEYAALVEFTTGYGTRSGGERRPHWNLLLKGIPADELDAAAEVIRRIWCGQVDAEPQAQHVGTIAAAGGLMKYLALHFQKEEQSPPAGWRGHRFLKSRGYLWTDTPEARYAARWALRFKRELWRARQQGIEGEEADVVARAAMGIRDATRWELVHVAELPTSWTADGLPAALELQVLDELAAAVPPAPGPDGAALPAGRTARRAGADAAAAARRPHCPPASQPAPPARVADGPPGEPLGTYGATVAGATGRSSPSPRSV